MQNRHNKERHNKTGLILSAALSLWAAPHAFGGYFFTQLATFNGSDGVGPGGDLVVSGNTLYGETETSTPYAPGNAVIFSLPAGGGTPTVLASVATNHSFPDLVVSGETLFGTAGGTIFSVPTTGGPVTTVGTYNTSGGLAISGNTLFGTTTVGGAYGDGTIFSVPVTGGAPTVITSFNASTGAPDPRLVLSGSTLFGTSGNSVYSVPITGGSPAVLASFSGPNIVDVEGLTVAGSTLYGTTSTAGLGGSVFSMSVSGGIPSTLATFYNTSGNPTINNGESPVGLAVVGGMLYGTATPAGNANETADDGIVFSLPIDGGTPTTLETFTGDNGAYPYSGGLTVSGDVIYGTTEAGGPENDGTVFALGPAAVPEPASVSLLALAGFAMLRRRR